MMLAIGATIITCLSLSAVDGDTIKCDGQNMRIMGPGSPNKSGVDAPEIGNAKCAKEKLLGQQARLRLEELLRQPGTRVEDSGARDRYGRPLVWVGLKNGSTAGEVLLRDGYAVVWKPGYVSRWCD
jgi:micrococcal nuclease